MHLKRFISSTCLLLAGCGGGSSTQPEPKLATQFSSSPQEVASPAPVQPSNTDSDISLSCIGTLYSSGGSDASSSNGKELSVNIPSSGTLAPQILSQNSSSALMLESSDHQLKISLVRKSDQSILGSSLSSLASGTLHFSHHLANTFAWMICNRSFKRDSDHAIETLISPALWSCKGTLSANNRKDLAVQNGRTVRVQTVFSDQDKEILLLSNRTAQVFLVSQSGKVSLVTRKKSNADQISYTLADSRASLISSSLNQASISSSIECERITSPQN